MLKYRIVQDIVYRLGFSVAELLPLLLLPGQTAHGKRDESLAGPCCGWTAPQPKTMPATVRWQR